ncbi:hypothetical protein F220043C3_04310 [Enterocloster asparagiformis]|uniref:hypothetical protein n=1 Tax=Enterocloster asparagiformis TaxID=333367 RepID=UPI00235525C9
MRYRKQMIDSPGGLNLVSREDPIVSGTMAVGWRQIDGKWYYFHAVSDGEMGKMYAGERTPDGYVVGTDGEWSH